MKLLALMTSLALSFAAATASEVVQRNSETMSWGTDKNFVSILADAAVGGGNEDKPSYCTMPPPNPTCYLKNYPKCCSDPRMSCPETRPPCECEGDCVSCDYPDADTCGDNEFCMIPTGDCLLRIATIPGGCAVKPEMCTYDYTPVCGCDGTTYGNACGAEGAGVNVEHVGECRDRRFDRRAPPPGSSYCTWSPNYDCFINGWPQCCSVDDQECPPDRQPRCDNHSSMGWDYCTHSPDETCYESGWPQCCERFGGTNCPTDKPNCDVQPTDNSEDLVKVKFLRNAR